MSKTSVTSFSLRPCIEATTYSNRKEFMGRVQQLVETSSEVQGRFRTGHAMISIIESKRHFWSPWMHLEYREKETPLPCSSSEPNHKDEQLNTADEPPHPNVIARFSPHPSIWTGFMLTYLALIVLIFFSLILGYSQHLAQQGSWGYYLVIAWVLVGFGLWVASQIGQRLAQSEMQELMEMIESCLEEAE